jgi:hypothetical protein
MSADKPFVFQAIDEVLASESIPSGGFTFPEGSGVTFQAAGSPVGIVGGDDGFGDSALVLPCADSYFQVQNVSGDFAIQSAGQLDLAGAGNNGNGVISLNADQSVAILTGSLTIHEQHGGDVVLVVKLPTSDPLVVDQLWNDAGTLKVSAG